MIKVLNLYAGIGGNRKLWTNVEVTAVEHNKDIAKIYQDFFPDDNVIVGDAHQYLLDHYKEFDFIWSSPPCPTHSRIRHMGVLQGQNEIKYCDMSLYQEIILLTHYCNCKWIVENVKPYYKLLIPAQALDRHVFWSNFIIDKFKVNNNRRHIDINSNSIVYGYDLKKYDINNKITILRNMVDPELGLHIFNRSQSKYLMQMSLI